MDKKLVPATDVLGSINNDELRLELVQRFFNVSDLCLGERLSDFGNESILHLLVQYRAELAQGVWIGS